jgi:hypothetical protein
MPRYLRVLRRSEILDLLEFLKFLTPGSSSRDSNIRGEIEGRVTATTISCKLLYPDPVRAILGDAEGIPARFTRRSNFGRVSDVPAAFPRLHACVRAAKLNAERSVSASQRERRTEAARRKCFQKTSASGPYTWSRLPFRREKPRFGCTSDIREVVKV